VLQQDFRRNGDESIPNPNVPKSHPSGHRPDRRHDNVDPVTCGEQQCLDRAAWLTNLKQVIEPLRRQILLNRSMVKSNTPEWEPIVPIMQILALVGAAKAIGNPTGSLVLAKGRADLSFRWSLIAAVCQLPVLALAVQSGSVLTVAVAVALFQLFVLGGLYRLLYRPLLGPCLQEWLARFLLPTAFAMIMALSVVLAGRLLEFTGVAGIALSIALGGMVYLVLCALFRRETVASLIKLAWAGKPDTGPHL
jgi:hypothetical protein